MIVLKTTLLDSATFGVEKQNRRALPVTITQLTLLLALMLLLYRYCAANKNSEDLHTLQTARNMMFVVTKWVHL